MAMKFFPRCAVMILLAASFALGCEKTDIAKLPEPKMWEQAQSKNTLEYYDAYLKYYPDGKHAKGARMEKWGKKAEALSPEQMEKLTAVIETNRGVIKFKFFPHDAPGHVRNFIKLAQSGFYNGIIFHRVVPGKLIQGGDPLGNGMGDPGYKIKAEFNGRPHKEGTVGMARGPLPDSAGCQFYICLTRLAGLDGSYTVFGQVTEGMDVVHAIGKTRVRGERPVEKQVMEKVYIEGL